MDNLRRLEDAGFRRVGRWVLGVRGPECRLEDHSGTSNVLYAFVSGRDVLYVGKTTMSLGRRMYGYQNPGPSQRTNIANHKNLKVLLESGQTVHVLVLVDELGLTHAGFDISLAAGLEDSVIHSLKPPWNKSGC